MKKTTVALFACPKCRGEKLVLTNDLKSGTEIEEGKLGCPDCHAIYPIIHGIPRFGLNADAGVIHQSKVYGFFHSLYTKEESFLPGKHRNVMIQTLGCDPEALKGKTVLDAGCGNGRYSDSLARLATDGTVIAMDVSIAVESAKKNLSMYKHCEIIQGDIMNPPFRKGVFDAIVSWGVIHHTPNPRKAFACLAGLLKPEGRLGVYVYELHPVIHYRNWTLMFRALLRQGLLIRPLRFICSRIPLWAVEFISSICRMFCVITRMDPFGVAPTRSGDRFNVKTWRMAFVDRFRSRFAFEHTYQEIFSWFFEEHFDDIVIPKEAQAITVSGRKGRVDAEAMHIKAGESMAWRLTGK